MVLPTYLFCCDAATSPTRSSGETSRLSTGGSSALPVSIPVGVLPALMRSGISRIFLREHLLFDCRNSRTPAFVRSLSFTRRGQAQRGVQCRRDPGEMWLICTLPVDPVESLSQDHRLVRMLSSLLQYAVASSKLQKRRSALSISTSKPAGPPHSMLRMPLFWATSIRVGPHHHYRRALRLQILPQIGPQ